MLAAVAPAVLAGDDPKATMPAGLDMLRRTERAFAKATREIGMRNGFLMFFAEDAIAPPDTVPARKALLVQPAPDDATTTTLEWEPLFGDIAQSGDMGYLTGPFAFAGENGQKHHGVYFSIWRRNAAGIWQVVLDAGVGMPSPAPEFESGKFRAAAQSSWRGSKGKPQQARDLDKTAREFLASASANYEKLLSNHARMHRKEKHPILGREAILADMRRQPATLAGKLIEVHVSEAGDLGWTFATCELTRAGTTQKGTLTDVWKRDDRGQWRIVLDVLNEERRQ